MLLKEVLWDSCAISDITDLNNSYESSKATDPSSRLLGSDMGISAVSGFHLNFIPEASHKDSQHHAFKLLELL